VQEIPDQTLWVVHGEPDSHNENNVAVEVYFQYSLYNALDLTLLDLLENLLVEPFFDQMRTKQQVMPYTVMCVTCHCAVL
jgi:secreted Zn-dependent insulinase-like peptidase